MADEIIKRDQNTVTVLGAITDNAAQDITMLRVDPVTKRLLVSATGLFTGTVTTVSVVSANGLAGTVANATTTPAITLSTTITGILKGNGTSISACSNLADVAYLTSLAGAVLTTTNQSVAGIKTFSDATDASNTTTGGTIVSGGLAVAKRVYALDMTVTNKITGSITGNCDGSSATCTGNAGTVTNGIYTTSQVTALAAVTVSGDKDKFLHSNASTGALEWATSASAGATTALDNLSSVAINAALIPGTAGALDIGSTTKPWASIWFAGTSGTPGTNQFKITGASTSGVRTITAPDRSITLDNITTSTTTNGTGFVKGNGSVISFDNSTYLTSVTAHNILSTTHGDTLADTVVRGDIMYGNATPKWARLPFPATPTGKVLQATATDVAWSTNALGTAAFSATGDFATSAQGTLATNAMPKGGGTFTGNVLFTDNTLDIGANGATRPRTGYFGTSIIAPVVNATTGIQINSAATSSTILTGNGTNYVPSTYTLAAPGTSGNVPTSDGNNWISAAPVAAVPALAQYTVGALNNALVKTYFNYILPFDTIASPTNWIRNGTVTVNLGGASAYFSGTGAAHIQVQAPLMQNAGTTLNFNSGNIVIMEWWAILPATSTGDILIGGFGGENLFFETAYNASTNSGGVCFFQSAAGVLYTHISKESVGVTNTDISAGFTPTVWNNFRIELDTANNATFYINGVSKGTMSGANMINGATNIFLGYGRSNTASFAVTAPTISQQMNP